jgi:hypothetical protein
MRDNRAASSYPPMCQLASGNPAPAFAIVSSAPVSPCCSMKSLTCSMACRTSPGHHEAPQYFSRARASLRDQPLALPAWDQQEETEQSDSRTDRGRAIDTRVQSELVSSIVPRGTSLRWIVAPTVWRSSMPWSLQTNDIRSLMEFPFC